MPDYQQGKIYTLRCRYDDTYIYVGSTIQSLAKRLGEHKTKCKTQTNRPVYSVIKNDWEDWYIELYELYPCSCKEELNKREGEVIREIGTLNKNIAGRTDKEYRQNNKEKKNENDKEYYKDNKEKMKENNKEYYKNNKNKVLEKMREKITCDCGCIICNTNINRHRKSQKHLDLINKAQIQTCFGSLYKTPINWSYSKANI